MKAIKFATALIAAGLFFNTAQAQESATLKKIKASGSITLGVRESSVPFTYLDDKQNYQGYSLDLCMKVVSAIQKQLHLSQLAVKLNPVTSATRIPLMANGTIDLECGSTTNNAERQQQVAFAPSMFLTATRLLSKKSSHINGLADLKGKILVSTSGTANLKELTALNAERNLGITIVPAKDHAEAFLMVETGRAAAFGMDDVLLASLAASSKTPAAYMISQESLIPEPYGIMMRRGDPEFKKLVDAEISRIYTSGEINRIYAKWFQSPIPPKGINLNWPMTEQLKNAFKNPTDSPNPAAYK
ncbi:MAG TPA: amino acid ABC transporter substrate-binding protein [Burkholderiaceae bacterium]|jgi:glutamate/aspartate transport system substrate-binding protein